jgi:hypothetical protein
MVSGLAKGKDILHNMQNFTPLELSIMIKKKGISG